MSEEHYLIEAMQEYFGELSLSERNLITSAINKMNKDLEETTAIFDIASCDTYEWVEDECMMVFSDKNIPKIIADSHYIGSVVCREWRWSWDKEEDGINNNCKALMYRFKGYVKQYDFRYLRQDTFPADERIGWVMSAIASLYGEAKLIYKIERCEATEFYVFSSIREVKIKREVMKKYFREDDNFWIIEVDDGSIKIHFGKDGTSGKRNSTYYDSNDKALKIANRYIKSKLSKGYIEVENIDTIDDETNESESNALNNVHIYQILDALQEFEEEYGEETFVESFYLTEDRSFFEYWLGVSRSTSKEISNNIHIFANADATGGKYGVWLKSQEETPVVFFGSEGEIKIIAKDLEAFLQILSLGSECVVGNFEQDFKQDALEEFIETYPNFLNFRDWLQKRMKLNPIELSSLGNKEANKIVLVATNLYEDIFLSWLHDTAKK